MKLAQTALSFHFAVFVEVRDLCGDTVGIIVEVTGNKFKFQSVDGYRVDAEQMEAIAAKTNELDAAHPNNKEPE